MKKLLSLTLCFTMVLASFAGAFAGTKETFNYVSLGSSQTFGYGLVDFHYENQEGSASTGFDNEVYGSFPYLMKNYLQKLYPEKNIHLDQLALMAMRSNDLLEFLYDDFDPDSYSAYIFHSSGGLTEKVADELSLASGKEISEQDAMDYLRNKYRNALKNADLITYDLGCGNFGLNLTYGLSENDFGNSYKNLLSDEEYILFSKLKLSFEIQLEALLEKLDFNKEDIDEYSLLVDCMVYGLLGYIISFDKTMEWIFENNPDATVIVMQIQNMASDKPLKIDNIMLPAGEIVNILITMANSYASCGSKYSGKYTYARLTDDQRVRFVIDDVLNYQAGDLMLSCDPYSQEQTILNIIKKYSVEMFETGADLKINQSLQEALINNNISAADYDCCSDAAYDAYICFLQYFKTNAYLTVTTSADEFLAYFDYINTDFRSFIKNFINDVVADFKKGNDYYGTLENYIKLFEALPENERDNILNYMSADICYTALEHPDYEGYKEMFNAVKKAYENQLSAKENIAKALIYTAKDVQSTTQNLITFAVKNIISNVKKSNKQRSF